MVVAPGRVSMSIMDQGTWAFPLVYSLMNVFGGGCEVQNAFFFFCFFFFVFCFFFCHCRSLPFGLVPSGAVLTGTSTILLCAFKGWNRFTHPNFTNPNGFGIWRSPDTGRTWCVVWISLWKHCVLWLCFDPFGSFPSISLFSGCKYHQSQTRKFFGTWIVIQSVLYQYCVFCWFASYRTLYQYCAFKCLFV